MISESQTESIKDPLFEYQLTGAEFLSQRTFALLADEQGVGKSAQAVRGCELVQAKSVLVICKAVARENWRREFEKWWQDFGLKPEVEISSYESIHKIKGQTFDVLIVDESHSLKEPKAQRTQKILGRGGLVHRAKFRWFLSGTPTPNHAGELWTLLFTAGRTKLPYEQFVEKFCMYRDTAFGRAITGTNLGSIRELKSLAEPLSIRRTKKDVLKDMPPITYSDVVVQPGKVDLALCESFLSYTIAGFGEECLRRKIELELDYIEKVLDGKHLTFEAVQALGAKLTNINTLRRFTGIQKVEPVLEMVRQELRDKAYEKVVIFAVHKDTIKNLFWGLKEEFGAVIVYGGTSRNKVDRYVDSFQNKKKPKVFIGNIQSAGTSITLTAAHQVIFVEQSFVPGDMAQAAMRCHRVGQEQAVSVRFIGLANSIDEYIARIIRKKTSEITEMMDGFGAVKPETEKKLTPKKRKGKLSDLL